MAAPITDAGSGVVRNRPVPAALDRSLGEVVARGKAFSGTAQNDDTNIVVDIGLFQYGEQFAPQLIAHGVALLRTLERHPQDRFAGPVEAVVGGVQRYVGEPVDVDVAGAEGNVHYLGAGVEHVERQAV